MSHGTSTKDEVKKATLHFFVDVYMLSHSTIVTDRIMKVSRHPYSVSYYQHIHGWIIIFVCRTLLETAAVMCVGRSLNDSCCALSQQKGDMNASDRKAMKSNQITEKAR